MAVTPWCENVLNHLIEATASIKGVWSESQRLGILDCVSVYSRLC